VDYADIIKEIRKDINDPEGNRWSDLEIQSYIDLGQKKISIASLSLEAELDYIGDSSKGAYVLPADFLEFTAFLLPNGIPIDLISAETLNADNTAKFLYDQTSQTPVALCLDFGSWDEIRFYPSPVTGVAIGSLKYKRLSVDGVIEIDNLDALVNYSLFRMYAKEKDKKSAQRAGEFLDQFDKIERRERVTRTGTYRRIVQGSHY